MPNELSKWSIKVRRQQKSRLSAYEPILGRWVGTLGRGDGVVQNPDYPDGYVFVRDSNGIPITVWNNKVPNTEGMPVVYGYDTGEPKLLQILFVWTSYDKQPGLTIPHHRDTHIFPGGDTVTVRSEQILPALVRATTGFVVEVFPFFCPIGSNQYVEVAYQTLDLTSNKPSLGARIVLIAIHSDGAVALTNGTVVDGPDLLTVSNIPAPSVAGDIPIAAVRLYSDQTEIIEDADYSDVFDLRWLAGGGGGGGTGDVHGPASSVDGHLAVFDGTTGKYIKDGGAVPGGNTWVIREVPSGTKNGSNPSFSLANTPVAGTEMLFLNGQLLNPGAGNDYTISGASLTMLTGKIPVSSDSLVCTYQY